MTTLVIFGLVGATSWIVVMAISGGSWKAITQADPEYAKKLYASPLDQVLYRTGPVSYKQLFCTKPPEAVSRRVKALRVAILIQAVLAIAFVVCILIKIRQYR